MTAASIRRTRIQHVIPRAQIQLKSREIFHLVNEEINKRDDFIHVNNQIFGSRLLYTAQSAVGCDAGKKINKNKENFKGNFGFGWKFISFSSFDQMLHRIKNKVNTTM